jgi:hypothetical protein
MTIKEGEGDSPRDDLFRMFLFIYLSRSPDQVDRGRRPIVQTLVPPLVIIKPEIAFDPGARFRHDS